MAVELLTNSKQGRTHRTARNSQFLVAGSLRSLSTLQVCTLTFETDHQPSIFGGYGFAQNCYQTAPQKSKKASSKFKLFALRTSHQQTNSLKKNINTQQETNNRFSYCIMLQHNMLFCKFWLLQFFLNCQVNGQSNRGRRLVPQQTVYELRTSPCAVANRIQNSQDCQYAAGIIGEVNDVDGLPTMTNTNLQPTRCFYIVADSTLYYNSLLVNSNQEVCSSTFKCLCTVTCSPGKYQNQNDQTSCKYCAAGQFQSGYAQGTCSGSSLGRYQDEIGKTSYKLCVPGRYQDQVAQSSCKSCPSGKYYPSQGLKTPNCLPCPYERTSNAGASTSSMCTYTCNTQGGSGFPASSCLSTGTLKSDLTIACATIPCVELDCCIQLVPDIPAGIESTNRSTGLRKVVDDWIAGGIAKAAVEAKYGFIENWDMSTITRTNYLFYNKLTFNADLSKCK